MSYRVDIVVVDESAFGYYEESPDVAATICVRYAPTEQGALRIMQRLYKSDNFTLTGPFRP